MAKVSELKAQAETLEQQGELEQALQIYEHVLRHLEGTPAIKRELPLFVKAGDLLRKLGRDDDALAMYGRAAEEYAQHGLFKSVKAICGKIAQVEPEAVEPYRRYGRVMFEAGHATGAGVVLAEYAARREFGKAQEALAALADASDDQARPVVAMVLDFLDRLEAAEEAALSAPPPPPPPPPAPPPPSPAPEPSAPAAEDLQIERSGEAEPPAAPGVKKRRSIVDDWGVLQESEPEEPAAAYGPGASVWDGKDEAEEAKEEPSEPAPTKPPPPPEPPKADETFGSPQRPSIQVPPPRGSVPRQTAPTTARPSLGGRPSRPSQRPMRFTMGRPAPTETKGKRLLIAAATVVVLGGAIAALALTGTIRIPGLSGGGSDGGPVMATLPAVLPEAAADSAPSAEDSLGATVGDTAGPDSTLSGPETTEPPPLEEPVVGAVPLEARPVGVRDLVVESVVPTSRSGVPGYRVVQVVEGNLRIVVTAFPSPDAGLMPDPAVARVTTLGGDTLRAAVGFRGFEVAVQGRLPEELFRSLLQMLEVLEPPGD